MKSIDRFRLEVIDAEKSRLFVDGNPTELVVDGIDLEAQFECASGSVLLISHDSPFEVLLHSYLIAADLRAADQLQLGA